ncbi:MAG: sulfite exporter TauE/SafE family protein [Flavobacteriales bacterium]
MFDWIDEIFLWCMLAGFLAQLVDGALGMGYGIVSATFLLNFNIPLVSISSSIHSSEIFTSAASGYSHYKFGNVDKKLFKKLVIPGVLGAILGAMALCLLGTDFERFAKPIMAAYILFLGGKYIFMFFKKVFLTKEIQHIGRLAGIGGFLDSFGGGGWGPLVTTTLLRTSHDPKAIIGSVSLTEFFVTFFSALTFFMFLGLQHYTEILGLIAGGVIAAPLGAKLAGKLNTRWSYLFIGILSSIWSLNVLLKSI